MYINGDFCACLVEFCHLVIFFLNLPFPQRTSSCETENVFVLPMYVYIDKNS